MQPSVADDISRLFEAGVREPALTHSAVPEICNQFDSLARMQTVRTATRRRQRLAVSQKAFYRLLSGQMFSPNVQTGGSSKCIDRLAPCQLGPLLGWNTSNRILVAQSVARLLPDVPERACLHSRQCGQLPNNLLSDHLVDVSGRGGIARSCRIDGVHASCPSHLPEKFSVALTCVYKTS